MFYHWDERNRSYLLSTITLSMHVSYIGHVLGELKMCHVVCHSVKLPLASPPSPQTYYCQPLTPCHWLCSNYYMPELSQPRFLHLVHHEGHSHLALYVFVGKTINKHKYDPGSFSSSLVKIELKKYKQAKQKKNCVSAFSSTKQVKILSP